MSRRWAAALLVALALSCDAPDPIPNEFTRRPLGTPTSSETNVIGLVGTMSGPDSWRGDDAFEGADLGVHILNREIGEGGRPYELVTLDDGGDAGQAAALVEQLAASPRTMGVIYAGPSEGLASAAAALAQAGIPGILCYGDLFSARLLRGTLFQVSPPYAWEARALGEYLRKDRGYVKVGALVRDTLAGRTARESLRAAPGLRDLVIETFPHDAEDYRPYLEHMKEQRVEALIIEGAPREVLAIAADLEAMGAAYSSTAGARIGSAPGRIRRQRVRTGHWAPQLASFDLGVTPAAPPDLPPPGTVASDSYARGAHYLPVPSLRTFAADFLDWWGSSPLGWEHRAYQAARLIGWGAQSSEAGRSGIAAALETIHGERHGGLEVFLSGDDHVIPDQPAMGLWTIPTSGTSVPERGDLPPNFPWVPLARSFAGASGRTDIPATDWKALFEGSPSRRGQAPRFTAFKFGITTTKRDPVH
ncbi:MAG TPA: ABC transporter substrate-binding protein [Actinomycetota bacterium]|nr:ABC transporter substrate-binding protein [Actinomycetota bacterium]